MIKHLYQIKITTSNQSSLKLITRKIKKVGSSTVVFLPKRIKRFVLLKSPHVNKSAKEHFQLVKHQRLFTLTTSLENLHKILTTTNVDLTFRIKKISSLS
jgi:ribosomal protein S10